MPESPLKSGRYYSWRVRVWDNNGNRSAWSLPANFHTGFFDSTGWKAKWIGPGYAEDTGDEAKSSDA